MEQMKVSTAIRAYPNRFLLLQAVRRGSNGAVEMANVLGVCDTKQEVFLQQSALSEIGVKTFIVPTFEETEKALSIQVSGDSYEVEPLLSPAEYAVIFRQYYDLK